MDRGWRKIGELRGQRVVSGERQAQVIKIIYKESGFRYNVANIPGRMLVIWNIMGEESWQR